MDFTNNPHDFDADALTDIPAFFTCVNAVASTRNRNELLEVVRTQFRSFPTFHDAVITKINEDGESHSTFVGDMRAAHQLYTDVTDQYPVNDGVVNLAMDTFSPVKVKLQELLTHSDAPSYARLLDQAGVKEIVAVALRSNGDTIAVLFLLMSKPGMLTKTDFNFVAGITGSLSIVVANMLANEKIERQVLEIEGYRQQLEVEKLFLQEATGTIGHAEIVGASAAMQDVYRLVSQVADFDSTVLILGETGTGKELIARAIHSASSRKDNLMIKVNCAALPVNLVESELFGHEKGSFTGATERRIGKFEMANNGTLFLDEIGEIPIDVQVKLLRALQEREIERIGGKSVIRINVRIIAATNRNLQQEVKQGNFRSDLFYRLNVFPISIPPLRERSEDIPALVSHFVHRISRKGGKKVTNVSNKVITEMLAYQWPGNIRELEHMIERSILLTSGSIIKEINLPVKQSDGTIPEFQPVKTLAENERDYILAVLKKCNGKISGAGGAASLLGVPHTTLNSKIKKLGIRREHVI